WWFSFFFQAEDGIRDFHVTGVQTCALPISFIKVNMPLGVSYENPFLSDEEAWDIAAFVNSMPRPSIDLSMDWPDISKKPVDHPRSEERRVGKERSNRWQASNERKNGYVNAR